MTLSEQSLRGRGYISQASAGWVLACLLTSQSFAQATSATFVTRGDRGRDVLRVDAILELPASMAFGNVQVTIASTKGPSTADRDLQVVFYIGGWNTQSVAYHQSVRLAEGQSQVIVNIPHMQTADQSSWDVGVYEGGRDIEDRRKQAPNQAEFQWTYQDADLYSVGALQGSGEPLAAMHSNLGILSEAVGRLSPNPQNLAANRANLGGNQITTLAEASRDWRRYFPYDSWLLSAATLREINQRHPDLAQTLRNYVAAGGTLWVHDAASSDDRAQVDIFLNDQPAAASQPSWSTVKFPSNPWWYLTDTTQPMSPSVGMSGGGYGNSYGGGTSYAPPSSMATVVRMTPITKSTANPATANNANGPLRWDAMAHDAFLLAETWGKGSWGNHFDNFRYLVESLDFTNELNPYVVDSLRYEMISQLETEVIFKRDYLNGRLLVTSKPLTSVPIDLLSHTYTSQIGPQICKSTADAMDGNWFWRNLIAAVGKPPVWTFCAMVTLFGALLGPGLLAFTGKLKRRSLMIFFVPCLSLLATVSIIIYGVFHEGLDTYVRVTSVQFIDPTSNSGFVWSRQNYFSGLPPREGLSFGHETYARNVRGEDASRYNNPDPRRGADTHVYLGEDQRWQGWLKARRQQQLLVGHPIENASMPILIEAQDRNRIRVQNTTNTTLPVVVVRGAKDEYYTAEALAPGATVVLEPSDAGNAGVTAGRVMVDYRPQAPPELRADNGLSNLGSRRSGYFRGAQLNDADDVINSIFRTRLSDKLTMPPFAFTVLMTESDQVEVPLQGKADENLHVVMGVYRW